jgi:hypothetical protein
VVTSPQHQLASVTIQNSGPATTVQVAVDLPGYGSPSTQTVVLAGGETRTVTMSPVVDFLHLFQLTTAIPAALNVSVTASGATLFQQSYPIEISGRDTVFWSNDGTPATALVATMVTPNDKANLITTLLHNAAARFPGGALVGYSGTGSIQSAPVPSIAPNTYTDEAFQVLAGETPAVTIDAVVNGAGNPDTASVFIVDDANFQAWVAGSATATSCATSDFAAAGTVLSCPTPAAGSYHIVYFNPAANFTSRTVTRHRRMTKTETTIAQTQAIFDELRAAGITYANLPGTGFFSASQNIMYPSESLTTRSANCIEGSLVFASAWERLGMRPSLLIDFAHGHAFAAVRCWADTTDCFIPIETTMVGGTSTSMDAIHSAVSTFTAWDADGSLQSVDMADARAAGLTPAPM